MRLRTLMIAVGAAAIILVSMRIRQRASDYQLKAGLLGLMETAHREGLDPNLCYLAKGAVPNPRMANYDLQIKRKYKRAAQFPWLPVSPDPPPPQ